MKKNIIIPIIITVITLIIGVVVLLLLNIKNTIVSSVTLDINPSIEINLDKNRKVVSLIALNEDANDIVSEKSNGKDLEEALRLLTDRLIEKGYLSEEKTVILIYSKGNIDNNDFRGRLGTILEEKRIDSEIIGVDVISKEDEALARKYNISPAKAAYINSVIKNDNVNIEQLKDKSVDEITEYGRTGNYCDEGYILDGSRCLKETGRVKASEGKVCPRDTYEFEGKCYEETNSIDGENDYCSDGFTMSDGMCSLTEVRNAKGICEEGRYDEASDLCISEEYIGDATEYCRDPGRTLLDHKCLATKPSINGGCLGNDMYYNGKCLNTVDDYYMSEYMCPDGSTNSRPNGELLYEDNRCMKEKRVSPKSYECDKDYTLDGRTCVRQESRHVEKEKVCPSGYTKIEFDRCVNLNNIKEHEDGFVCDQENTKVKGNECIIYEIKEAYNKGR